MHQSVFDWVSEIIRPFDFSKSRALEVGSLDVNGTVRSLFTHAKSYTGIDLQPGTGVDFVMNAHYLGFKNESFDLVVCTEMIEHDNAFWLSMNEIRRVLKKGGILLLTARGNGFMIHDFPCDYWRFLPNSFPKLFDLAGCQVLEIREDWQPGHPGLFGIGRKK